MNYGYIFNEHLDFSQHDPYAQSSKLAGSPKSQTSEIMFGTSENILVLVWLD